MNLGAETSDLVYEPLDAAVDHTVEPAVELDAADRALEDTHA